MLGILLALKLLIDAQRLSRTTLFSLEQERASEQTYRALMLIVVLFLAILVVLLINVVVAPLVPPTSSIPLRGTTPTVLPVVLSTQTPTPTTTFTPPPRIPVPSATLSATATRTATRLPAPPSPLPTATLAYLFPAPKIIGPLPNGGTWIGEGQANAAITFRWTCEQCVLGPNDWYEVVITFIDRNGIPRTYAGRTQSTALSLKRIYEGGGFELYQKAKEDVFHWYVLVKREPGNHPISPPSETWKFVWK